MSDVYAAAADARVDDDDARVDEDNELLSFGPATYTTARAADGTPTIVVHPPLPIAHVGNELELSRSRKGEVSLHL